jgi:hypothetical protein
VWFDPVALTMLASMAAFIHVLYDSLNVSSKLLTRSP